MPCEVQTNREHISTYNVREQVEGWVCKAEYRWAGWDEWRVQQVMLAMLKLMQWGLCLGVVVIFGTTGGRKLRGNWLAEGLPRIWLLNQCVWG